MRIKILTLCSSSRRDPLSQTPLDIAALGAADAGVQVSLIRWLDFPLPFFVLCRPCDRPFQQCFAVESRGSRSV
jgi:hypothetical protein